jgi:hypothetical protein
MMASPLSSGTTKVWRHVIVRSILAPQRSSGKLCAAPGAAAALALRNEDGRTPLALALRKGHAAIASALCAHGAL